MVVGSIPTQWTSTYVCTGRWLKGYYDHKVWQTALADEKTDAKKWLMHGVTQSYGMGQCDESLVTAWCAANT